MALRACGRTPFPNSVPEGRLNLAQDASPGLDLKGRSVPQGRLELGRHAILDILQASFRDLIMVQDVPGLASFNNGNTLRPSARRQIEDNAGTYLLQGAVVFDGKAVQDIPLAFGNRGCGALREYVQRFSITRQRELKSITNPGKRERLYFDWIFSVC